MRWTPAGECTCQRRQFVEGVQRRRGRAVALGMLVVAALIVAHSGVAPMRVDAATPSQGTLRWRDTVIWSGELTGGGASIGNQTGDMSRCPEGACDEFALDIQVPPSPNPNETRFVQIEIHELEGAAPLDIDLVVFPPGADPAKDWTQYTHDIARLLDPRPGTWRVQVRCFTVGACATEPVTYSARATTGALRIPRAVAHRAGGVQVEAPDAAGRPPVARLHQVGANAFEPTLGVTADGSVFYQAVTDEVIPKVLRSQDGGVIWENVSPRLGGAYRHPNTSDPFLHVDEDTSRVFTVDLFPALACTELSFTDDGGGNWTTSAVCEDTPDHHSLVTGPPVFGEPVGYENVVYWCVNGNGATMTICSKSLDGGITFVPTGSPAYSSLWPIDNCAGGLSGHGTVGPDGTLYLPRGFCDQPFIAISGDEGLTWTQVQVADNGMPGELAEFPRRSHEASVAVDDAGTLYYVWAAADRLPYLAVSKDAGETWSVPMMIGAPGVNEAAVPTIDARGPGEIAIAYMATQHSPGGPPFPGEGECALESPVGTLCPQPPEYEGVPWSGYVTITDSAGTEDPVFFSTTLNDPADPLVVGACGPFRCEGAGDFFDVVIAADGTTWASFVDVCVVDRCAILFGEGVVGRIEGGWTTGDPGG